MDTQQWSIPEVLEPEIGMCIEERKSKLPLFQDLGPADLVSITKTYGTTEIGTFLYYTGAPTGNSTTVAIFLKELAELLSEKPQAWFGKNKQFNVTKCIMHSYNAFSRVDCAVSVHIPGTVNTEFFDVNGEEVDETEMLWTETFVSGVVRAMLESDEEVNSIVELRSVNPFLNENFLDQFYDGFAKVFHKGPALGSGVQCHTTSLTQNYLVDTFIKLTKLTDSYERAAQILLQLEEKYPQVSSILVRIMMANNQEVDGVKMACLGLQKNNRDYELLMYQARFLLEKGAIDLATSTANACVNAAPSEFEPWRLLSECYIAKKDIDNALLALNSCPMGPVKEKFQLKRCVTVKSNDALHLPLPMDCQLDVVSQLNSQEVAKEQNNVDGVVLRLPASNLKSNFAIAYDLLCQIVQLTGWEELLKHRADIFVMEEEYQTNNAMRQKRLCERWLDNLFMLLYEDLKVYTMSQAEIDHFGTQNLKFNKVALEWELLGACAMRLHHFKEASEYFERAGELRFSPPSSRGLIKILTKERDAVQKEINSGNYSQEHARTVEDLNSKIIDHCVKLMAWNHRWYSEFAPYLIEAVRSCGGEEVSYEIQALYPEDIHKLAMEQVKDVPRNQV